MHELSLPPAADARRLTAPEFQRLAAVPAAAEWFANLDNPRTRRAYRADLADFCHFLGLTAPDEFRAVTRAHVLAWRGELERRGLAGATPDLMASAMRAAQQLLGGAGSVAA